MRRRLVLAAWLAALVPASAAAAAPAPAPPRRVASLNLAADEVLAEILPPGRLVAVTSFVDEKGMSNALGRVPPAVARLPRADLERLVALSPDLVVVSEYTDADFLRVLERSGLRFHRMGGLDSMGGVRRALLDLGEAVGAPERARALVARSDAVLADLRGRLRGVKRPRVLYWSGSMTAGGNTMIGALMEEAGAVNAAREAGISGIVPIGAERAFGLDPDVVLIGVWPGVLESLTGDPLLSRLRAVREGRIVQMPTELLVALSHHAATAAWHLAHALHPRAVERARP